MTRLLTLLILITAAGCQNLIQTRPAVIDGGQANADIVIAEQPTRMQRLAAEELQTYLRKITGATLPIVTEPAAPVQIYVGRSRHTERLGVTAEGLDHGAFRQVSGSRHLVLIGDDTDFVPGPLDAQEVSDRAWIRPAVDERTKPDLWVDSYGPYMDRNLHAETGWWKNDRRGSLNAVYAWLRDLGVRWYMPGELGEVLPELTTIDLPRVDRTVKPQLELRHHDVNRYDRISREEILWHYRLGLLHGHDFYGDGGRHGTNFVHGRDETKAAHPDWFALWNGKRQTDHNRYGAPCLSSEELVQATVRYCRDIIELYNPPAIDIGVADNLGKAGQTCECDACMAQYTPERPKGKLSDYVWRYYDRVAREVYRTHPDTYITAIAYQQALQPPLTIQELSPNVLVGIANVYRTKRHYPELLTSAQKQMDEIRQGWQQRVTSGQLYIWDYYLTHRPNDDYSAVPAYYLQAIVNDLRELVTLPDYRGEHIEIARNLPKLPIEPDAVPWGTWGELYAPGYSHLNIWLTARLYWDVNQDAEAMLAEYFSRFYGPAAADMHAFVMYCEENWPKMGQEDPDRDAIEEAFRLIGVALQAAGDSVYGQRIQLIVDFMQPLMRRRPPQREALASLLAPVRDASLTVDGRLDDPLWDGLPRYSLSPLQGHARPTANTTFQVAWVDDALCLAIRCEEPAMQTLQVAGTEPDDRAIFSGDVLEILIETQTHAHYQIAINPAGLVADLDRENRLDWAWTSRARIATSHQEDAWTVEVRLPFDDSGVLDADSTTGVSGRPPIEGSPWYVNICRHRPRGKSVEDSAFSPTGDAGFHARHRFVALTLSETP